MADAAMLALSQPCSIAAASDHAVRASSVCTPAHVAVIHAVCCLAQLPDQYHGVQILLQVFKQSGLGRIETEMGAEFDPNLHNALFEVPTDDVPAGCVCTVTKTGYTLNGRVIRAADVGVARPATE